jgi:predicted N-formylglutamate amidohydrolase
MTTHPTHDTTEVMNPNSEFPVLLLCEHAGNRLPGDVPPYLGMDHDFLESYHGYDIGIPHVARQVAKQLNATCILGVYSRLLIDLNRGLDSPDLLHDHDDGIIIPANQDLTSEQFQDRLDRFYHPFHEICAYHIERLLKIHKKPHVFAFHSFPRHQTGYDSPFPWQFTIHHNESYGLADHAREFFDRCYPDVKLGDNDPYDLKHENIKAGFILHGQKRGLSNLLIEIPNDQIRESADVSHWASVCAEFLAELPG